MSLLHREELGSLTLDRLVRVHRDELSFAWLQPYRFRLCPGTVWWESISGLKA
jgi:hypothetical protein